LYFASQRVWRSEDRGNSWKPVSGDLSRKNGSAAASLMGRVWSIDAVWDLYAMSVYGSITSISESPLDEKLFYVGTDDGLYQVTEDGGQTWRRSERLPGVPEYFFVNDIKADLHDANTVYICVDNHKAGDFKPYVLRSKDRGLTWVSIAGDLPERHIVWRLVQDHVNPNLLFVGTEFGVFFTINGGEKWIKLTGDVPTIPFRDLAIQKRENDLVGATFGAGSTSSTITRRCGRSLMRCWIRRRSCSPCARPGGMCSGRPWALAPRPCKGRTSSSHPIRPSELRLPIT